MLIRFGAFSIACLMLAIGPMTYAVRYLAGAYRVANGNLDRAVHYYAAGYYYAAKNKGIAMPSSDRMSTISFASTAPNSRIKFASEAKLGRYYAQSDSGASPSSLYSGRLDYH